MYCRVCGNSGILNKTCVALFFLLTFTVIGCRNKVDNIVPLNIVLKHYTMAATEKNCTMVVLLKAYPVKDREQKKGFANLYICEKQDSKELIFIFETDKTAPGYLADPDIKNEGFCIYSQDVNFQPPSNVSVDVPKGFSIPNGSAYLFASLYRRLD